MAARAGRPARVRPHRRCVGCGRIAPKSELLRIALLTREGRPAATIDPAARMPGRGAYLCRDGAARPAPACLQRAIERNAISRTLRCKAPLTLVESVPR
ncbi:MAG: YlxR family protein [Solirubrobacteraceae bacterium]